MRISQASSYIKNKGFEAHKALLLYGNNESLLQFYLDVFVRQLKDETVKVEIVEGITGVKLGEEPSLFAEDTQKKIIVCRQITGKDFDLLQQKIAESDADHRFIFVGSTLNTKSKLVKFFQTQKDVGSLPCYDIDVSFLRDTLLEECKAREVSLSSDQINFLVETYRQSPVSLLKDFEKIQLYLSGASSISDDQLKLLVNGSLALSVDKIIEMFLLRNKEQLLKFTDLTLLEEEPYMIMRSLIRHLITFCEFLTHSAFSSSSQQAFGAMKSFVFYNTKSTFERALTLWTLKEAAMALKHLLSVEKKFKNNELSLPQFQAALCAYTHPTP